MNFLKNAWYCVGWSSELVERPLQRRVLGRPLVLYRDSHGQIIGLDGACPHRFAPLGLGSVNGDTLTCPYHGLKFDRSGACIHNPHGEGIIPPQARVNAWPVVERGGAIWVWPGETEKADQDLITPSDWLVNGQYAVATGSFRIKAHYQVVIDNLLDLTHAPYLHAKTLGGDPEDSIGAMMEHDFRTEENHVIHSDYFIAGMPKPTPQMLPLWGDRPGDFRAEMLWRPASSLELDVYMSPVGSGKSDGVHVPSFHFLAPEDEHCTNYYFAIGRNVMIEDEEQTRVMGEMARLAFEEEDEPMIEACQSMMGTADLFSLKPAILQTDIASVQARRLLAKLVRAELAEHGDVVT